MSSIESTPIGSSTDMRKRLIVEQPISTSRPRTVLESPDVDPTCCSKIHEMFCCKKDVEYNNNVDTAVANGIFDAEESTEIPDHIHILEQPLEIGSLITIIGTPEPNCQRFSIDVGCGDHQDKSPDLLLHFNPRLPQRYVVRNSKKRGTWGEEETTSTRPFPFSVSREFRVDILRGSQEWLVAVDGVSFCEFPVRWRTLGGGAWVRVASGGARAVKVRECRVESTDHFPPSVPGQAPLLEIPHLVYPSKPIQNWVNPALGVLPSGLVPGQQLVVLVRVKPLPHSFLVNVSSHWRTWPHPRVLLHVNPRFDGHAHVTKHHVVLNTWENGSWGAEQRQSTARLLPGAVLELRIVRASSHWTVWAGTRLLGTFSRRPRPSRDEADNEARSVLVQGDVEVQAIYTAPAPTQELDPAEILFN